MEEKAKVKEHKTIVDSFVEGARNGYKISINSMVPNVLFRVCIDPDPEPDRAFRYSRQGLSAGDGTVWTSRNRGKRC